LPDLLRRVAVLTVLSAAGIALLAPLTARSALPDAAHGPAPLLAALPAQRMDVARGPFTDRAALTRLALAVEAPASSAELIAAPVLPTPAAAPMQATLRSHSTPAPAQAAAPAAAPVQAAVPPAGGDTVTGRATWYCCTAGYRGQAVVALPGALGGHYDPPPAARSVTVCADRCVSLPVVDFCGCSWGTASQKVADLSPEAWAAITDRDRSAGVVTVTVHLGG
jgi:hypothetical protein